MKIYRSYKEIEIKDIRGARVDMDNKEIIDKVDRRKNMIEMRGFRRPFEVVKIGDEYHLISDRISFVAAKILGYDKVPCLIRDMKKEILLRRLCKKLEQDGRNYERKRNEKRLNYCRKNYYKLNVL